MALVEGKVLWENLEEIFLAMQKMSPDEWENAVHLIAHKYTGKTNGSYFVFQNRKREENGKSVGYF
jgi:hypothetical protein